MVNYTYENALHNAALKCDLEALLRCLTPEALAACPIDTRDRDELESTALHALCRYAREYREDESRRVDDRNADVEVCLQLLCSRPRWSGTSSRSASTRATTKQHKSPFNDLIQLVKSLVSSAASQILRLRALHAWVQVAGSK